MRAASNGRTLRIALATSAALHLAVAATLYARPVTAAPEQLPKRMYILHMAAPTPTPLPPIPPAKHVAVLAPKRAARVFRPEFHPVHVASVAGHSQRRSTLPPVDGDVHTGATDAPAAVTSGPPAPTTSPKPACTAPDTDAKAMVVQQAIVPDDSLSNGFTGAAEIKVDLDATGAVVHTGIYESTGSMELDRAALQAAAQSRYEPGQHDCKKVPGSYLFTVEFQ